MDPPSILIAGIGNIFLGDDAFGPEVLKSLQGFDFPAHVRITDFGIRGYDLAYALADGYDYNILVDACPRGDAPGTIYLLELDPSKPETSRQVADGHSLNPYAALQLARNIGCTTKGAYYLVGCEPLTLECQDGEMGLSKIIATAVPRAVELIGKLLGKFSRLELKPKSKEVSSSFSFSYGR